MTTSVRHPLTSGHSAADGVHLAERLRFLRVARGWSQRQLAARADLNPSTISRIESGSRGITSISTLSSIAVALGCAVDEVLGEQPSRIMPPADAGTASPLVEPVRHALLATTLTRPPVSGVDPLPFALVQADIVHERRRQCDFRQALRVLPSALTSLHFHLHSSAHTIVLPRLVRLCLDGCAVLAGVGDLSSAWILAHRCADTAALDDDPTHRALAGLAVAGVALQQRADHRAIEVSRSTIVAYGTRGRPAAAGFLHLTAAIAGGRAGLLSASEVRDHFTHAARAAALAAAHPDTFGLVLEPALVPQARFHLAVQANDLAGAEQRLQDLRGSLCREPGNLAAFLVDLARYHLDRGEHHRSLDAVIRCEQVARQYAHHHPEAARILAQLAVAARTDTLRRRVSGVWQRFRQPG